MPRTMAEVIEATDERLTEADVRLIVEGSFEGQALVTEDPFEDGQVLVMGDAEAIETFDQTVRTWLDEGPSRA